MHVKANTDAPKLWREESVGVAGGNTGHTTIHGNHAWKHDSSYTSNPAFVALPQAMPHPNMELVLMEAILLRATNCRRV